MRRARCRLLATSAACVALSLGASTQPSVPAPLAVPSLGLAAPSGPSRGELWLAATRDALAAATRIEMPFAERGVAAAAGTAPTAFALSAHAGQTLEVRLVRDATPAGGGADVYVEVFRVIDVLGHALHERLAALRPSAASLSTRLPSDGTYHVLVQGGPSGGAYRLTLELGSALPFPVVGARPDAVRSLFGASRDAGERSHQGIDIFVKRLTPVLAVAAGNAVPSRDALGGNTVWLNTPGTSYYYAHLDRVAVRDQQRVKVGDVLGYVGNTGNARGMPAHLHFGVYRWGRQPIDPLPLLVGQRFAEEPEWAATRVEDSGG